MLLRISSSSANYLGARAFSSLAVRHSAAGKSARLIVACSISISMKSSLSPFAKKTSQGRAAVPETAAALTLREKLRTDLKTAMQAKNKVRVDVIKSLISGVIYADKEKGREILDEGVLKVIRQAASKREESINEFKAGNRMDLVEKEEAELKEILTYLPQQLSKEEITAAVKEAIAKVDAKSPKDMRAVLDNVHLDPARAPKKVIAEIAKQLMTGGVN